MDCFVEGEVGRVTTVTGFADISDILDVSFNVEGCSPTHSPTVSPTRYVSPLSSSLRAPCFTFVGALPCCPKLGRFFEVCK